jgi:hypothetical protein
MAVRWEQTTAIKEQLGVDELVLAWNRGTAKRAGQQAPIRAQLSRLSALTNPQVRWLSRESTLEPRVSGEAVLEGDPDVDRCVVRAIQRARRRRRSSILQTRQPRLPGRSSRATRRPPVPRAPSGGGPTSTAAADRAPHAHEVGGLGGGGPARGGRAVATARREDRNERTLDPTRGSELIVDAAADRMSAQAVRAAQVMLQQSAWDVQQMQARPPDAGRVSVREKRRARRATRRA